MSLAEDPRVNVLGVGISAVSMGTAVARSIDLIAQKGRGYVCVTGVHGVMEAQGDKDFRRILNRSFLTAPDGVPTVWVGKLAGFSEMTRVYGPEYMLNLCQRGVPLGYRHFLYGGKPGVAEELGAELRRRFPGLQIAGTFTPPFRPLNTDEENELRSSLEKSETDILWVGLSTPKQERFMARYHGLLPVKLTVGVGAAFDIISGNLRDAPAWMKRVGMQWLYRLIQEPGRLWRRYLTNNPKFLMLITLQLARLRFYELGE